MSFMICFISTGTQNIFCVSKNFKTILLCPKNKRSESGENKDYFSRSGAHFVYFFFLALCKHHFQSTKHKI